LYFGTRRGETAILLTHKFPWSSGVDPAIGLAGTPSSTPLAIALACVVLEKYQKTRGMSHGKWTALVVRSESGAGL